MCALRKLCRPNLFTNRHVEDIHQELAVTLAALTTSGFDAAADTVHAQVRKLVTNLSLLSINGNSYKRVRDDMSLIADNKIRENQTRGSNRSSNMKNITQLPSHAYSLIADLHFRCILFLESSLIPFSSFPFHFSLPHTFVLCSFQTFHEDLYYLFFERVQAKLLKDRHPKDRSKPTCAHFQHNPRTPPSLLSYSFIDSGTIQISDPSSTYPPSHQTETEAYSTGITLFFSNPESPSPPPLSNDFHPTSFSSR